MILLSNPNQLNNFCIAEGHTTALVPHRQTTVGRYPSAGKVHFARYNLYLWLLTLKTSSAISTYMTPICG